MILYCPIDIPKVPEINLEGISENKFAAWDFYRITEKKEQYSQNEILESFREKNPKFIEWLDLFPWTKIMNIKYNYQNRVVESHIDFTSPNDNLDLYNNNFYNEPCGYRCVIKGKSKNALYVVGRDNQRHYVEIPDDTDTYVINHTTGIHGVDGDIGRETLFFHFEIDSVKHRELLKKSYEKYKDYVITVDQVE